MPRIHPTAIIQSSAELAEDVEVGPYCLIEADVSVGAGCLLRSHVVLRRYTSMGKGNVVDAGCVLGGEPQDLKFDPATVSYLRIGDGNIFREGVTISRATGGGNSTRVGSRTYWMAGAHAGHNATVEDGVILANGCAVGGHATVGAGAILSAHVGVHQFCWVGERVMSQGHAGVSTHVPPYVLISGDINSVVGLNTVGLRRAPGFTDDDRRQIKEAFCLAYRAGLTTPKALERMDACTDWGAPAAHFRDFIRRVLAAPKPFNRGLCPLRRRRGATAD